jgi:hypothetical protein
MVTCKMSRRTFLDRSVVNCRSVALSSELSFGVPLLAVVALVADCSDLAWLRNIASLEYLCRSNSITSGAALRWR